MNNQLESADIQTIKSGLRHDEAAGQYTCLECGSVFEEGEVYPLAGRYYTAARAARQHAATAHGGRLGLLLASGSKYLGLTDNQRTLLQLIGAGCGDAQIAAETGTTAATVRRQRFAFREKAKQARTYLAVYELAMEGRQPSREALIPIPAGVRGLDERFVITQAENERYIKNAFESTRPLRLRALPVKEKRKVAVLNLIIGQFEHGRSYTEQEVNAVLREVHPDEYVTLRRYLIEYGFLDRERDGSRYWVR